VALPLKLIVDGTRMRYATYRCGPWGRDGRVSGGVMAVLRRLPPRANPDFENAYQEVVTWWLEIDEENGVSREIAFNASGQAVAAAPLGENCGIFADLGSAPEGLGPEVQASAFERTWREFANSWRESKSTGARYKVRIEDSKTRRYTERLVLAVIGLAFLGVSLLLFLISAMAAISGIVDADDRALLWWAVPCVVVCGFLLVWSTRLILGKRRKDGGLMSSRWIVGFLMAHAALLVLSVFSGVDRSPGLVLLAAVAIVVASSAVFHALERAWQRRTAKETMGNRVGAYRTTMRREVLRLPIPMALVAVLVVVLTTRGKLDAFRSATETLFAYAAVCCLVFACLWLCTLIWKVTLFEGGVRGPTSGFRFQTLAWSEIRSARRIPLHLQSINPFRAVLQLQPSRGLGIQITEPLAGMQEFKEHVRRLAGEDHPFARLLHER
jgi:hypothetical protein